MMPSPPAAFDALGAAASPASATHGRRARARTVLVRVADRASSVLFSEIVGVKPQGPRLVGVLARLAARARRGADGGSDACVERGGRHGRRRATAPAPREPAVDWLSLPTGGRRRRLCVR